MAQGDFRIEFWPRYSSATAIRVPYLKRVYDLSGTDVPIIRSDVIELKALHYAYMHMYAKFGDARWKDLAERAMQDYEMALDRAIREDLDKHGLPRSVQDYSPSSGDWDYHITHDVG